MDLEKTSSATSCSSSTNWTVAGGSLLNSLSFESSLSPIDEEVQEEEENTTANSTTSKSPLILRPSSPDSGPCEIKIDFTQKHEVRQVYVRSTARVYEIYYHSGLQSDSEYLCTVRCGIALRDEGVLTAKIEELVSANRSETYKDITEEDSKSGSNLTSSEDDWVEVKVPNAAVAENKNFSLPSKADSITERSKQEFYEATAEITDGSPCRSLTLRLLSHENKGFVFVDEVYVFADPVDSADSEDQGSQVENSSGSSLMAMLVPALLQLSKTTKPSTDTREKQKLPEYESRSTDPMNFATEIQQEGNSNRGDHLEVKWQKVNGSGSIACPAQLENFSQVPISENKPDYQSTGHLERAMDQLVSRMGRIEDLCLRFEENMLKPINSIESRLQRVEQQIEVLLKKSHNSELRSCLRICAPEFSCNGSDSNSFCNSGSDYPNGGSFGSDKKDFHSGVISVPPYDVRDPMNATQLLPSLVVTAPDFSNSEDAEENFASDSVTDSFQDKQRQVLSIDDALASALAGFISSSSIQPSKYTQTVTFKAPEFLNEEDENDDKKTSPGVQCEIAIDQSVARYETDATVCMTDSTSSNTCLEGEETATRSHNDDLSEKTADGGDKDCRQCAGGAGDCQTTGVDTVVGPDMERTDSSHKSEESINEEVSNQITNVSVPDNADTPHHMPSNPTENVTSGEDGVASSEFAAATEQKKSGFDILQKVLEFSCASSVVDFRIPVLDVKFATNENSNAKAVPLEDLLADVQESTVDPPCIDDTDDNSPIAQKCNLILVQDVEPSAPATDGDVSLDLNYCNLMDVPLIIEGESLQDYQDYPTCSSHEVFPSSLI